MAIDLSSGAVTAYPKPLSLDPGSWDLFADLEPHIEGATEPFFVNEWHLDPNALHPDALDPDARDPGALHRHAETHIALVAFPTYVAGAPTRFEPLSRAEGLLLLLQNSFNMATAQGAGLQSLAGIAASAQLVRLTVGDLDDGGRIDPNDPAREPRFRRHPGLASSWT